MDAVMIDAMIVEAVSAERERIRGRLMRFCILRSWLSAMTRREILDCVEEG